MYLTLYGTGALMKILVRFESDVLPIFFPGEI